MTPSVKLERVQTGIRMDKTLLKVLKGVAEFKDMSLADLVEGVMLHALEGKAAITDPSTLAAIDQLRDVYGLKLTAEDAHKYPDPEGE